MPVPSAAAAHSDGVRPSGTDGRVLTGPEWRARQDRHHARVDALLAGHRERAATGLTHPVEDFLFTYYSHRPGHLRRWHPGPGVLLQDADQRRDLPWHGPVPGADGNGVRLDAAGFGARRRPLLEFLRRYLAATGSAAPAFGCFGLHEWAMVYRTGDEHGGGDGAGAGGGTRRHAGYPLRLGSAGTDAVVEASAIRCTHVDAFRFFTPPARPRNALQPTRETSARDDQPGCLHVGMDLYKWAYKLAPAVPAELVADCFELARDIRALDMRASPYDLTALGYDPVPIETPHGRSSYAAAQRELTARGRPLREQLREVVAELLAAAGNHPAADPPGSPSPDPPASPVADPTADGDRRAGRWQRM